jgi:hypothetical protein
MRFLAYAIAALTLCGCYYPAPVVAPPPPRVAYVAPAPAYYAAPGYYAYPAYAYGPGYYGPNVNVDLGFRARRW